MKELTMKEFHEKVMEKEREKEAERKRLFEEGVNERISEIKKEILNKVENTNHRYVVVPVEPHFKDEVMRRFSEHFKVEKCSCREGAISISW